MSLFLGLGGDSDGEGWAASVHVWCCIMLLEMPNKVLRRPCYCISLDHDYQVLAVRAFLYMCSM